MTNLSTMTSGTGPGGAGISWGWLLALGILMAVLGVVGLGMTYWLTIVAMFWFGALAIVGGIAQLFDAFHHKGWKGITWHVVIGLIYIVAGVVLIAMPVSSALWLTLFLAASLVVIGVFRIVLAFQMRGPRGFWFWVLLSGLISIVLGVMIYGTVVPPDAQALATAEGQLAWVKSWGWVIGLFVALELIMEGAALIAIAMTAKALQQQVAPPDRSHGVTPAAPAG
ncbi:MAG: DUF308 domain-containing protein [Xanthobacteraceae bacterium]